MTRQEWLDTFDREIAKDLAAKFDILVARVIAEGGNEDDLAQLTELWQAEVAEGLPPLRARAIQILQAAPDHAIAWD